MLDQTTKWRCRFYNIQEIRRDKTQGRFLKDIFLGSSSFDLTEKFDTEFDARVVYSGDDWAVFRISDLGVRGDSCISAKLVFVQNESSSPVETRTSVVKSKL